MYRRERVEHRFVQRRMVGVDSSGMLSKIVESRERFTTMAREWTFSSVLSGKSALVSKQVNQVLTERAWQGALIS